MSALTVSGAQTYGELCIAAKSEDRRQTELAKRQHYQFRSIYQDNLPNRVSRINQYRREQQSVHMSPAQLQKRCYICNGANHLAKFCKTSKSDSRGSATQDQKKLLGAKKVVASKDSEKDNEFAVFRLRWRCQDHQSKGWRYKHYKVSQHMQLLISQQTLQLLVEDSSIR